MNVYLYIQMQRQLKWSFIIMKDGEAMQVRVDKNTAHILKVEGMYLQSLSRPFK